MEEKNFENYKVSKTKGNGNPSDFLEIMRRFYGENISLGTKDTEGYKFGKMNLFIDFGGENYGVRIFGDGREIRNLVSKLENITGFAFEQQN